MKNKTYITWLKEKRELRIEKKVNGKTKILKTFKSPEKLLRIVREHEKIKVMLKIKNFKNISNLNDLQNSIDFLQGKKKPKSRHDLK